jgi:preprotein translocase SecE subunit
MSAKENIVRYWTETQAEIRKVAWPTREEMVGSTVATIVISSLVAFFIWVADMGISQAVIAMFKVLA